jgi:hypothetical protein
VVAEKVASFATGRHLMVEWRGWAQPNKFGLAGSSQHTIMIQVRGDS